MHPALKHLTGPGDVLKKFLEVDILVPQLVDTGEEGYGTVEKVARMLDVAALELHFSVGEP